MIVYDEPLWRPPSEAYNLILQATLGCSFNRCSFCSMYRSKDYEVRPLEDLCHDMDAVLPQADYVQKVFLADGDAFGMDSDQLLRIADELAKRFPNLQRITAYAWPLNILKKSPEELAQLRQAKLSLLYLGMESGWAPLLKKITKGATPQMIGEAIDKAREAGIKISATAILGLGGETHWQDHIDGAASLISAHPPRYLSTLQLRLAPEIQAEFYKKFKEPFVHQSDRGMLFEQRRLIAALEPKRPLVFRSNHVSNSLALAGNLPKDQSRLLDEIDAVLDAS